MSANADSTEVGLAYYAASASEIRQRVTLRDQTLVLYMTGVGAILAFGLRKDTQPIVLVGILLLGWGASMILRQHEQLVGMLREWCATEHHSQMQAMLGPSAPLPFELSAVLLEEDREAQRSHNAQALVSSRKWGYQLILVGPQVLLVAYGVVYAVSADRGPVMMAEAWIVAVLAAVSSVLTWRNVSGIARFRDSAVSRMQERRTIVTSGQPAGDVVD